MSRTIPLEVLRCPACTHPVLRKAERQLECPECGTVYPLRDAKPIFLELKAEHVTDPLDKIKYVLKKFAGLYNLLILAVSPVYFNHNLRMKKFVRETAELHKDRIALNIGSGSMDLSPTVSNIDIFPYEPVDMTCDISNLPLQDDSVDVIVNKAVLEHVPDPEKVVAEMYRVLKPGADIFITFPFVYGFHASPYDYSRRTSEGVKHLMRDFEMTELSHTGGPVSGFLLIFQEFLAMLLSFGIRPLHMFWYLAIMCLTCPLKYLDIIFSHHPMAKNISAGFVFVGKKK